MTDDTFGEAQEPQHDRPIKIIWPGRPANTIEGTLLGMMTEALALQDYRAPVLFVGEDETNADTYAAIYGAPFTVADALMLQDIIRAESIEKFRRQMIVARECGERATMADYLLACEAEGIDPLIRGNKL